MSVGSKKYYLATLGCSKNEIDSESLEVELRTAGVARTDDVDSADLIIVNSCGFINDAKIESIDMALQLNNYRKNGSLLVMCGCLPARYNLEDQLDEIDLFLPSDKHNQLMPYLKKRGWPVGSSIKKIKRTIPQNPFAYLKISEGCDNRCTYCAIPDMKGSFRSRPIEELISEAEFLCENFAKEIVLVGQDTTLYGSDSSNIKGLPHLIDRLVGINGLEWIRLMYAHPAHLNVETIETIASNSKVVNYIDIPLQHINDNILRKMNRKTDRSHVESLIAKIRSLIPDIVLRTTFIVGFPGETESDFAELLDFCESIQFDNLGVFKYSPEEGTPAGMLEGRIEEGVVEERYLTLLDLQNKISKATLSRRVGETHRVLLHEVENEERSIGRTWFQAPEVDGCTYVENPGAKPGDFVNVEIIRAEAYDLFARQI